MLTDSRAIANIPPSQRPLKRVLMVSPHFAPINAPDSQRIRTMLPYLAEFGWEAEILTVAPEFVEHPQDAYLTQLLPPDLAIHRTAAFSTRYTRKVGLGNLGLRCLPLFQRRGDRLLSQKSFDAVFFSTTIFPVMTLGARWQRKFGVPYVLDFQDPWLGGFYQNQNGKSQKGKAAVPPGGRFKYAVDKAMAQFLEPKAMQSVSHVISVSPDYPELLQQRYPHLSAAQCSTLPFGAPEDDFAQLPTLNIRQSIFDPKDGDRHWVYVGRGGADMATALRALFYALQQLRQQQPEALRSLRLHFVGTSYAQGDRAVKTVEPLAQEYGLSDLVTEYAHRIPYFEAQQLLLESDAILMIGSDDPRYTASKLYPAVLARKPILAIFHPNSTVVDILQACRAGHVATFTPGAAPEMSVAAIAPLLQAFLNHPKGYQPLLNWPAFEPYTARAMTRKLCEVFDRCATGRATV
ncbi:MAG: hypothetical protein MH252_19725 [Thermosynechococcaceae cyanobacterium MS004]|nr:hypothetical protein [Thermosynechococcaceae cyanobacterium MS004]